MQGELEKNDQYKSNVRVIKREIGETLNVDERRIQRAKLGLGDEENQGLLTSFAEGMGILLP